MRPPCLPRHRLPAAALQVPGAWAACTQPAQRGAEGCTTSCPPASLLRQEWPACPPAQLHQDQCCRGKTRWSLHHRQLWPLPPPLPAGAGTADCSAHPPAPGQQDLGWSGRNCRHATPAVLPGVGDLKVWYSVLTGWPSWQTAVAGAPPTVLPDRCMGWPGWDGEGEGAHLAVRGALNDNTICGTCVGLGRQPAATCSHRRLLQSCS